MPPELVAEIRTVDVNGEPTTTVIATSNAVPISEVTHDGFYHFVFPSSVTVPDMTASYAVVLLKQNSGTGDPDIGWTTSTDEDPYPDGQKWTGSPWELSDGQDFFFKVYYDAPSTTTTVENVIQFDQTMADRWFISTDNTMELDMRFMASFCIDGTGTMIQADPNDIRRSEAYLFALELMRRAPESYIDVWVFSDTISEYTANGPVQERIEYAAAFGSIESTGSVSRLWAAAEQAIGNCDASVAVDSIVRDEDIPKVLDLMRQMNRIDYDELSSIDSTYDPTTGFDGITGHGKAIDFIVQTYAETMGRLSVIISDGFDDTQDTDPENVAVLANAVVGENRTPVNCFSIGANHLSDGMIEVSEATSGIMCEVGENIDRLRESLNYLLNDADRTIFQGWYEDTVEFGELSFMDSIEIGVIMPLTTNLTFQISVTYDGENYSEWETIPSNMRFTIRRFIWGFKYRIRGWMGNVYGGNYYDIYGFDTSDVDGTSSRVGCRYLRYYGDGSYDYAYTEDGEYYYRDADYPSPKVYSLRYWTVSPAITYGFTEGKQGGPISEYVLAPTINLPDTAILNWGIVRGDSTDFGDSERAIINRRGVLPNRISEIYYTPDVSRIGLKAVVQDISNVLFRVFNDDGSMATWVTTDDVMVFSGNNELDPNLTLYQLDGERGYILFAIARTAGDSITVNITTPGQAETTEGEICTTNNQRTYFSKNGPWPWDAEISVRVNGSIRRDGYTSDATEGTIFFLKELDQTDLVTVEVNHSSIYRVAYELKEYDDLNPIDPPDFGFIYSRTVETDSLFESGLTSIPVASNVTLLPSGLSIDPTNSSAIISISKTDRLIVSYDFFQEEGNVEQGTTIEWFVKRNGDSSYSHYTAYDGRNVQRASEVTEVLPAGPFQEGDLWYVEVTPRDVNSTGELEQSNIVMIGTKIPPYITAATITAISGDDPLTGEVDALVAKEQALEADYTYVDPNLVGDQTESDDSKIEWFRSGDGTAAYTGGPDDKVLPASYVTVGDVWSYVITPYDGINYGNRFDSDEVTITQEKDANTTV